MPFQPLSRRTFLRGAGVALALPFLDAMLPLRGFASESARPPQRFLFIYTPNGYHQPSFVPQAAGLGWEPTPTLEPLTRVKEEITILTGLDRRFAPGTGVHAQCGACWLSSSPPDEALDGGFPTNVTVDQLLARTIGRNTPLPSLELSCNDHADNRETRYFESISWYGPGYPAMTEKDPRVVFRRLFGQQRGGDDVASVLDAVMSDAKGLERKLGREDREKVGEYLQSVRETERRIQLAEESRKRNEDIPLAEPSGVPERRGDYIDLMGQLIAFAFKLDLTRVATLVVDPERWDSPRMYHDVFDSPQNHHVLTHTKGDEAAEKLARIDRFHVNAYARLVQTLKSTREGEGTLLDNSLAIMGSGISDGRIHDYGDLNVLIAGRGGNAVSPGRHLIYDGDIPLANLWLSLLQSAGAKADRFADSSGTIQDLTV